MKKLFNVAALSLLVSLALSTAAQAEAISVMTSGGFTAGLQDSRPEVRRRHRSTPSTALGPSMGKAPERSESPGPR